MKKQAQTVTSTGVREARSFLPVLPSLPGRRSGCSITAALYLEGSHLSVIARAKKWLQYYRCTLIRHCQGEEVSAVPVLPLHSLSGGLSFRRDSATPLILLPR